MTETEDPIRSGVTIVYVRAPRVPLEIIVNFVLLAPGYKSERVEDPANG